MFRSNLTTEIKLEEGTYTVIAHFRWFETNGTQHDMARQQDVKRRPPPLRCPRVSRRLRLLGLRPRAQA